MEQRATDIRATTRAVVRQYLAAINRRDLDAFAESLTEDVVFENTHPPPDGERLEGRTAVVAWASQWLRRWPDATVELEELFDAGDRAVVRWIYRKTRDGTPWHLRGVEILRLRNGKIAEALAYVKG